MTSPETNDEEAFPREYLERNPAEAARRLEQLAPAESAAILSSLDPDLRAPVLDALSPAAVDDLADHLEPEAFAAALERLDPVHGATLVRAMAEQHRQPILDRLAPSVRQDLDLLLRCEPGTAGAMMDPRVMYLQRNLKVGDALARLRQRHFQRRVTRGLRLMLIVDGAGRLDGMIPLQDLALAELDDLLEDYMQPVSTFVAMDAPREEIVKQMDEHRVSSLPVVDAQQRLIGTVRYEELMAAAKEDAVGDIQALFGVSRSEQALSPAWFAIRKRLPWLQINLATGFLASAVVGLFEDTIAKYTALAVLLPLVAGQSGNTGAQALAVAIRGLALHEISITHWPKLLGKELLVGIANGVVVALTVALCVYLWSHSVGLTLVIALAMLLSMVIACASGAAVPLLLTRFGQDPAQSSSILLTTITDVAGFFTFLGIAGLFIGLL
ncbi:MAG: magnesium transporter [Gammaproteobacteria bacterium]|nr:magnesium transporter [Gammaproteobacteria bacterium]